jgi:hypothetical protein
MLDGKMIKVDWDVGFTHGRQFSRRDQGERRPPRDSEVSTSSNRADEGQSEYTQYGIINIILFVGDFHQQVPKKMSLRTSTLSTERELGVWLMRLRASLKMRL